MDKDMNWKGFLRRSVAFALAVVTIYLLVLTGGASAAGEAFSALTDGSSLVLALVKSELGGIAPESVEQVQEEEALSFWHRLVLSESTLLQSAPASADEEVQLVAQEDEDEPEQSEEQAETPIEEYSTEGLDPEDPAEESGLESAEGSQIITRQFAATENYPHYNGIYLYNKTSKQVDLPAVVSTPCPVTITNSSEPQVLIVHTHATEAYQPTAENPYTASDSYRTLDNEHNITRVGEEVKTVLEGLGITVIHDTTAHDYPSYNGSYTRSAQTIEQYLEQYPSIQVVLDIHRDAVAGEDGSIYKAATTIDGEQVAQVLLIVGTDEGGQQHDNWMQNLSFATAVQTNMNLLYPTLARPITLRTSRFNQQYRVGSLLVEIGTHGNTLEECLSAARHFARSLGLVLVQNRVEG